MKRQWILGTLGIAVLAVVLVVVGISGAQAEVPAAESVRAPLAPAAAELHVCPSGCTYASVQDAVDAANEGDVIKVAAGTYTDIHVRPRNDVTTTGVVPQVAYVSKTVTIRGGYTTTNWAEFNPEANPTTLDAQGQGRVLYVTGDISPTIEGLRITGGDADRLGGYTGSSGTDYDVGGGMYVITATAIVNHNLVFSNTAVFGGGLCLNESAATLNRNTVTSNTAASGGGLHLMYSDNATLNGNNISCNTVLENGGGLNLWDSDATLNGNTVSSNTAGHIGGGFHLWRGDATLRANTVSSNTADHHGGGLALAHTQATLNGNIVASNTGKHGGGGLWLWDSDATLSNNLVADSQANTASGSGLCISGSSVRLLHTTIACNKGRSGVYVTDWS